jgi:molybdate-binding protein
VPALGLDSIELNRKPYYLAIRRKDMDLPPMKKLLEKLCKSSLRRKIKAGLATALCRKSGVRRLPVVS